MYQEQQCHTRSICSTEEPRVKVLPNVSVSVDFLVSEIKDIEDAESLSRTPGFTTHLLHLTIQRLRVRTCTTPTASEKRLTRQSCRLSRVPSSLHQLILIGIESVLIWLVDFWLLHRSCGASDAEAIAGPTCGRSNGTLRLADFRGSRLAVAGCFVRRRARERAIPDRLLEQQRSEIFAQFVDIPVVCVCDAYSSACRPTMC